LTTGQEQATATLLDNAAARDFASLLPLTVTMHDLFGREKPGALPRALDTTGVDPVFTYQVGDISYWPPSHDVAIFYADDGATIPSPGLIRLGTVTSGLELIAGGGDPFALTIALD
jgi:hypothetical protein